MFGQACARNIIRHVYRRIQGVPLGSGRTFNNNIRFIRHFRAPVFFSD